MKETLQYSNISDEPMKKNKILSEVNFGGKIDSN